MDITCRVEGMERLDPAGRYIFASNHPFGGPDGLMLADKVAEYFGDVRLVVNDLLMNLSPLRSIFVPVNKHGRQSAEYSRVFTDAFSSDIPIVTFPAGLCSRRRGGVVEDLRWKPNFIRRAVSDRRDVVPVFFEGELSNFFYRLSSLRTALGIRANIEMLYLVDEMFRLSGRSFAIRVGEAVKWEYFADGRRPQVRCDEIRRRVYALR
jgi:putative hemolysin